MKINRTALAAAASIAAVVVAGTAALAANFGVLSATSPGIDDSITPTVVAASPAPPTSNASDTTPATDAVEPLAYQVDGVGVVTLERTGDTLRLSAVDVDPDVWGWAQEQASDGVGIRFTSGQTVIAFTARIENGQVVVEVVDETPPAAASYDDAGSDDRYDDHDSAEHDDDNGSFEDDD